MQKTFDQGCASRLSDPASAKYFLAHHGVYKGSKLRVVFDAAAPFRGKSLNGAILSGPALQPALAAVICRFWQEEVAWASDIEAMFSRFHLASRDADYFCFLWRDKETDEPTVCRMNRLPFGASCSPFVAIYAVRQIIKDAGVVKHIVTAVQERMYVDDYLSSAPSVVEALREATAVKAALANADLNLQRWVSNSREFVLGITTEVPMDQPGKGARRRLEHPFGYTRGNRPSGEGRQQARTEEQPRRRDPDYHRARRMAIRPRYSQSSRCCYPLYSRRGDVSYHLDRWTKLPNSSGRRMAPTNQIVVFDWTSVEVKPSDVAALSKLDARFLDLVRRCQSEVYAEELQRIKKGKPLHTTSSLLAALEQKGNSLRYPSEDLLRTLLYEVAGLLNTCPLTYASSDPADFRPLTPNDFLNRSPTAYPPAGTFGDAPPRDHYRYLQRVLNLFWDLWKTVYLQSLAARKKWKTKQPNFEVGDVVLEINKSLSRGVWNIGHIVKVFPGSDGCVRTVDVQLPSGIFRRGITELCLLESSSAG
ncbi:hypothetical protein GHT06_020340 [Daphnia sinensis]|uniref:DUF5641 domain-containing protein n=1 Tax=Daphnia sinensis TaxID=1820382 RepID=A0AAD5KLA9_9CRUS|nr:hypothetical protein GHT06_020340 [Daphnia sinensis]